MKKEYRPMAFGFWGVAVPLAIFGVLFCQTTAERVAVFLLAFVFLLVGYFIYRAKQ